MAKSIKLKDNDYWDTTGVVHNKELLSDYLNNLYRWKLAGSVDGTSTFTLPSNFNELFISLEDTTNGGIMSTGIISKNILNNSLKYIRMAGGLTDSSSHGSASEVLLSLTQYKLSWVYGNNKNISSQIKSTIYYR